MHAHINKMNKKLFVLLWLPLLFLFSVQRAFSRIGSDPSHMGVVATLSFENEPLCVAVNEVMGQVYIGDETGFFVIDSEIDEIVDHISLDFEAEFIAVDPVTNHMYVSDSQDGVKVTYVLDGVTYSVIGEIPLEDAWSYYGFALNPTMNRIYIPDRAFVFGEADYVRVYDASSFSLLSSIEIPGSIGPYVNNLWVAINPQMNLLYATWGGNDSIYLIDCETNEILKTATLSDVGPLIVNWATGNVYLGSVVLEGTSLEPLWSLQPGSGYPKGVNPYDNLIINYYEASLGSSYLLILDGTSHEMLAALTLDFEIWNSGCESFAVNTVTGKIYMIHTRDQKVSVIEERSGPQNHVVINEFELNPPGDDDVADRWVELYNPTSSDVDISDWVLCARAYASVYSSSDIPSDTVIEAGGYYLFALDYASFALDKHEDTWIELEDLVRSIYRTPMKSDLTDDDRTWQRSPDGCDHWVFQKSTKPVTPVVEDVAPVADAGGPYNGEVDTLILFTGSGSYDPEGELIFYEWDFGDGRTKEGDECYHIYEESGTYTVTLTVTDAIGNIDTDQTTVTVLPSQEFLFWSIEPIWIIGIFLFASVIIGTAVTAILLWRRRK